MKHVLRVEIKSRLFFRYNLSNSNVNDDNFDKLQSENVPDVILVRKFYGHDKSARRRARLWKLKHLASEVVGEGSENK